MPSLFLHKISVVHVYLYIAATTPDPVGRDPCQIWSFCTQNSDLSTVGHGRINPGIRTNVFPQAAAAQRGVVCLSRVVVMYEG